MIETHKLVPYPSNIHDGYLNKHLSYKCLKCNHIIFWSIDREIYWKYPKGIDYDKINDTGPWVELTLSCNEEIVKGLLE